MEVPNAMGDNAETLRVLDKLIGEVRDQLNRAKAMAELIPQLSTDLASLERTRAMVAGDADTAPVEPRGFSQTVMPLLPVTEITLTALREAGKPMVLDDIMAKVHVKVSDAKRTTVMSHLSRFVEAGRVRRTAPSTYEFVK